VLLRCYVGRAGDETIVDLSDDRIIQIVLDDLSRTMDIGTQPDFAVVSRWKDSMPQYTVEEAVKGVLEYLNVKE
jgi:oxygen-dependent protoporphyrinogen oxidase